MCNLYNLYIDLQLKNKEEAVKQQKREVNNYLKELQTIKPFIEHYINYNDLLNGKVNEIPKDFIAIIPNYKLVNITIKNYYTLYNVLLKYEDEVLILKKQKIKYTVYKYIITEFNIAIINNMLKTGKAFHNLYFGTIELLYKTSNIKVIDWSTSNKNKQEILDRGGEPYLRENYLKALEEKKEYRGEKWLVKRENKPLLRIRWRISSAITENVGKTGANFKIFPARGKYGIINYLMETYKNPNHDYSIYNTK